MKKHVKTVHEKVKNYRCRMCTKRFATRSNLKRHVKLVHEKKKDFQCDDCDREFSTKANLVEHRINTHEVHHICEQCYRRLVNPNRDLNFPIEIAHTEHYCLCRRR